MAKIEKGTLLSFSGGEYSDKWNFGPFEVLIDFDQAEVVDAYLATFAGQKDRWGHDVTGDDQGFVAWLTLNDYIRDVEKSYDWYLGSYDFEPVIA